MPSETASRIYTRREGAIATVTFDNAARLNALSFDMWSSLPEQLEALDRDPEVRVIVLQGEGEKAFCSGSDISQFGERRSTPEGTALYNTAVDVAVKAVANVGKPTVARVRGYCFGGGAALAIHCDLRYAAANAAFCIPAGKVGLGYNPLWLQRLASLVGPAYAKEIMYTAQQYDAAASLRMGLINAELDDAETDKVLQKIAGLAPLTHVASKVAIDSSCAPGGLDVARSKASMDACFASADYIEGRQAFSEKRKPVFTGS